MTEKLYEKMGIYAIVCLENQMRYIGSSTNLYMRKHNHFSRLRHGISNKNMQKDYDLYGADKFVFSVLEYCDSEDELFDREQYYLDKISSGKLYNILENAKDSTGYKHTDEAKKRISKPMSEKHKKRLIEINRNRKMTQEQKQKISDALKGREKPTLTRSRLSNLTLDDCFNVKRMLLEETGEKKLDRYNRICREVGTSQPVIYNIIRGKHWSSEQLGGAMKEWS